MRRLLALAAGTAMVFTSGGLLPGMHGAAPHETSAGEVPALRVDPAQGPAALRGVPDSRECRRRLFPPKTWFRDFPELAMWTMPDATITKEVRKLREKIRQFEQDCRRAGLSIRRVYAAAAHTGCTYPKVRYRLSAEQ